MVLGEVHVDNSLVVAGILVAALLCGYLFYGRFMARLWGTDPSRKTPAVEHPDGIDYVPAKHWTVLFGHHFSSIAGAGPIIGPVIACFYWGWLPALIWIVIGSIFLGAVHDFSALMASLRHKGQSIAQVAEAVMGKRTKIIFALFLWLALVLVIAVFAYSAAKALTDEPKVVLPTFGLIPVAIFTGLMMYRWKINQVVATIIGVAMLLGLILLGANFPLDIKLLGGVFANEPVKCWTVVLLIYGYIASVTPVNILLQPRDYLATFVLYFGMLLGFVGLIVTHPPMRAPAYIAWDTSKGPIWPMLFVFVACGAISGFHSLISSGTTSKQITSEAHAKRVGYGAMIFEGVLAGLAVLCVCAGLYWQGNPGWNFKELMYPKEQWILAFGRGFGQITGSTLAKISGQNLDQALVLGTLIGIITIKTFIMTTLDSATRIGRYVSEELFGATIPIKLFRNRFVSTIIIIVFAGYLALWSWKSVWPVFGAANQLVAALALMVVTVLLMKLGKPAKYTFYPAMFMLITTMGALSYQVIWQFIPQRNYLLAAIGVLLIILAAIMTAEGISTARKLRRPVAE
ncbi:MAG: carbon starvation protein A [Actinobacteria bacterium]|nr:carbon starvation protein A [Actinomycetota bacterium]